jgi:predicted glycoside hydrolase/deacetylase ChbG (UPF0249 family)
MDRFLIVNADDFGQSPGINRGIATAYEAGTVTSASLMVRFAASEEAARFARANPDLSVGLHVDLGEWSYREGEWEPEYEVVDTTDARAVAEEVGRQMETFAQLMGRTPTHLDSHQHAHREEPLRSQVLALGRSLGVPVRHESPLVRYEGGFYGQDGRGWPMPSAIGVEHVVGLVRSLPSGVTELGCHPAADDDLNSMYRSERTVELETLCDPRVLATLRLEGIRLCSFHELASIPA